MEIDQFQTLKDSFLKRRFFDLREKLKKHIDDNSPELFFYRGAVANKFNRMTESVEWLEKYLKTVRPRGEKLRFCYELLADNYAKSFQYESAAEMFNLIIKHFGSQLDKDKKQDAEYLCNLWSAASDFPPQTTSIAADTHIRGKRNKLNHLLVPVEVNGFEIDLFFDTGADVCSISVSNAEKFGLQISESDISVGGSACRSNAKITIAPLMKIGNVIIKNVVFLVLEDKDFYLEKYDYRINGVIGYTVIAACRQITVNQNDEVLIPLNALKSEAEQNLLLDEMKPVLQMTVDNKPLTFFVDTGANKTKFFPNFFKFREKEIKKAGKLQTGSLTGVGGSKNFPAYIVNELKFSIYGKTLKFKDAMVFTVPAIYQSEYHYANIGQDWIIQFEKMTIDFIEMSLVFE